MAISDSAAVQWLLKEVYPDFLVEQRNIEPTLLDEFVNQTLEVEAGGKYLVVPIMLSGGESVGAYLESSVLAGGAAGSTALDGVQGKVFPKLQNMTHRFTGLERQLSRTNKMAFFNSLDRSIQLKSKLARLDQSRQAWMGGRGVLGGLGTASTGGDITAVSGATVTFGVKTNMQHFAPSMRLDFYADNTLQVRHENGTGAIVDTVVDQGRSILSVDYDARQIVMESIVDTLTAPVIVGDVCTRENVGINAGLATAAGGAGAEITGLLALVQKGDVTTFLQAIDILSAAPTGKPEYRAHVDSNGGTERDLTEDLLQKFQDRIERIGGKKINFWGMNQGQRRMLIRLGLSNVRHASAKLRLGYEELSFNGMQLFVDWMAPLGMLVAGDKAQICRSIVKDWGPLDDVKGGERTPHFDIHELAFGQYGNMFIKQTNAWGWIKDLSEP